MIEENIPFKKKIAKAVSRYCREHGVTHQEIADKLGMSKSQVDTWFSLGTFTPKGKRLLIEEFGVPENLFEDQRNGTGPFTQILLRDMMKAITKLSAQIEKLEQRVDALEKR